MHTKGKRRWSGSKNLVKPDISVTDTERKNVEDYAEHESAGYWNAMYDGYEVIGPLNTYQTEFIHDPYISIRMRRKKSKGVSPDEDNEIPF